MQSYETTATVEDHGHVRVAGVPFAPGTEVEVVIREKIVAANVEEARARMGELFALLKARNTESVGPLHCEERVYAASSALADQAHRDLALELLDRPNLALFRTGAG